MGYRQLVTPVITCPGPVIDLDLADLSARGIRGLVLDFDDTLLPIGNFALDPAIVHWVAEAKNTFQVWIVSNNPNRRFLENMGNQLGVAVVSSAQKPSRKALRKVLVQMDLSANQVAMVGDRLFTDVLAGNRLGMLTILVRPPGVSPIFWRGGLLRRIENFIAGALA
jgi:HAD superfamily phosphatase (TIGR01668 family)